MKLLLVAGSIFLLAPLLFFIPPHLHALQVLKEGKMITATIISKPDHCAVRNLVGLFIYNDKKFTKRLNRSFCEAHRDGDSVQFLCSTNYPGTFVWPGSEDEQYREIVSSCLLSLFGLVMIGLWLYEYAKRPGPYIHPGLSRPAGPNRRNRRHPKNPQ